MKKLRFKYLLLGAFMLSICSGLTGCKDYDDDIDDLQKQIDEIKATSLKDLQDKIDGLRTDMGKLPYFTDASYSGGVLTFTVNGSGTPKTVTLPVPQAPKEYTLELVDGKIILKSGSTTVSTVTLPVAVDNDTKFDQSKMTVKVEDGNYVIYYDNVATGVKIPVPAEGSTSSMTFTKGPDGSINGVTIIINGESATFKFGSEVISSLVSIPWYMAGHYGQMNTLNHIINEGYSYRATPVFEYNKTNKRYAETLSEGWGRFAYRVNPSNIDLTSISVVGFDNERVKMENQTGTRAMTSGMKISDPVMVDGKMVVKVKGNTWHLVRGRAEAWTTTNTGYFDAGMFWRPRTDINTIQGSLQGWWLDDPYGGTPNNNLGDDVMESDRFALVIKGKDGAEIRSDFAPVKRLVVRQHDLNIGLNKTDLEQAAAFTRGKWEALYPLYPSSGYYADYGAGDIEDYTRKFYYTNDDITNVGDVWKEYINDYKIDIPVQLNVPFKTSTDLKPLIEKYADYWFNNLGRSASIKDQYLLEDLGFEGWSFEYAIEDYFVGEVNQSTGAPKNDNRPELSYMQVNNGVVSFTPGNTAVIGREPMVRVTLKDDAGQVMMIKLLKLKVYNLRQKPITVPTDDWQTEVIPCVTSLGYGHEYGAYPAYADRYIDMDQVFKAVQMSKEEFVWNYTPANAMYNPGGIGTAVTYAITCDGVPVVNDLTTSGILVRDLPAGSAIDWFNRVCINIAPNVKAGHYKVTVTFGTQSTVVENDKVIVVEEFDLTYPENASLTHKVGMWMDLGTDPNMVIYGQPTTGEYGNPFLRQGFLENGFSEFKLGTTCGFLHFELVNSYGGEVVIEEVPDPSAGGAIKHQIRIVPHLPIYQNEDNDKYVSRINDDNTYTDGKVKIRVRAYVTHATAAHNGVNRYNINNDVTNTAEFDVIFVDPVHYRVIANNKVWLRDKAILDPTGHTIDAVDAKDAEGWKAPVYKLFNIYETWQGENTNGKIWNGAATGTTGWIANTGIGFRDLHRVKVYYKLDPTDNTAFVMANATVSQNTGNLTWVNSGDAVAADGVKVVVTVMIDYNWCPVKQTIAGPGQANDWYKTFKVEIPVKKADAAYSSPGFWYPSTNY